MPADAVDEAGYLGCILLSERVDLACKSSVKLSEKKAGRCLGRWQVNSSSGIINDGRKGTVLHLELTISAVQEHMVDTAESK